MRDLDTAPPGTWSVVIEPMARQSLAARRPSVSSRNDAPDPDLQARELALRGAIAGLAKIASTLDDVCEQTPSSSLIEADFSLYRALLALYNTIEPIDEPRDDAAETAWSFSSHGRAIPEDDHPAQGEHGPGSSRSYHR
jgi:hypothetical protein